MFLEVGVGDNNIFGIRGGDNEILGRGDDFYWEEFCCVNDSVNFYVGLIEVFAVFDGFNIVVTFRYFSFEVFIESFEFSFATFGIIDDFFFGDPFEVKVAIIFIFDKVLVGSWWGSFFFSSPEYLIKFWEEYTDFINGCVITRC